VNDPTPPEKREERRVGNYILYIVKRKTTLSLKNSGLWEWKKEKGKHLASTNEGEGGGNLRKVTNGAPTLQQH